MLKLGLNAWRWLAWIYFLATPIDSEFSWYFIFLINIFPQKRGWGGEKKKKKNIDFPVQLQYLAEQVFFSTILNY